MAVKKAEIIELDSDDEDFSKKETSKPKTCNVNCINFHCQSGVNMFPAPSFACFFYGLSNKKKKRRMICESCFNDAMSHQEQLVDSFKKREPIFDCKFPDHTMEVEISDSDSDKEDENGTKELMNEEDVDMLGEKLLAVMNELEFKYDIQFQIDQAQNILQEKLDKLNMENAILEKEMTTMMNKLDTLRNNLYAEFRPNIKEIGEIHINVSDNTCEVYDPNKPKPPKQHHALPAVATKKVTQIRKNSIPQIPQAQRQAHSSSMHNKQLKTNEEQPQDSQPEILHEVGGRNNRLRVTLDLPPPGPFVKQYPVVDSIVFITKDILFPWTRSKVVAILSKNPFHCRVRYMAKRHNGYLTNVSGKQIALASPCPTIIPVGTRVVAIFEDGFSTNYYSGIIAEPPKSLNKYRYLVFFDDGYAQYVQHKYVHVVCESSLRVYEDIPKESQDFIKKYLESYPERPMVKLSKGQILKTEWNGKWWLAKVVDVDASLVQMHFNADGRTEWIYRGSARLRPIFVELMKANARQQGHHNTNSGSRLRIPPSNKNNLPYVEYTSMAQEIEDTRSKAKHSVQNQQSQQQFQQPQQQRVQQQVQSRAVARKSTARKQPEIIESINNTDTISVKPSHSIVYYTTENKIEPRKYVPHKCGPQCFSHVNVSPEELKGCAPLSIPLLCGWNRQLCTFSKGKKVIMYQGPCGVRFRNMDELHRYLRITKSSISVDLFEFDHWVHCLAKFVLDKCFINIKDISYGVENVPIECVNEVNHALPDTITYTTEREPTEGVFLNTDPEFLCSCDCQDDCQDKSKCQCWQLTIQGATLGGKVPNTNVGYVYKRLPEPVTTGIYECNSRCKCSVKTCLNRVAQHPMSMNLQVFQTNERGWGIRCLNDIPHGSFICIYAGRLLTEQGANEGGKNYGDEYLAELDYVEVVEGIKEGYESDVVEPEGLLDDASNDTNDLDDSSNDEDDSKTNGDDSDEDFRIAEFIDRSMVVDDSENMRRRLRKRKKSKKDEETNQQNKNNSGKNGKETVELDSMVNDENITKRREPSRFDPSVELEEIETRKFKSVRDFFGEDEAVYIMDAKTTGNIGRYLNHSCDPNVFVQNVFVDTHDVRFPWVAFFALHYIRAGQELTWNYSYDVGSIPGKVILCQCGATNCRGRLL